MISRSEILAEGMRGTRLARPVAILGPLIARQSGRIQVYPKLSQSDFRGTWEYGGRVGNLYVRGRCENMTSGNPGNGVSLL